MDFGTLGLIFADGKLLTATEAAAYIKSLNEEIDWLRKENLELKIRLNRKDYIHDVEEAAASDLHGESKPRI